MRAGTSKPLRKQNTEPTHAHLVPWPEPAVAPDTVVSAVLQYSRAEAWSFVALVRRLSHFGFQQSSALMNVFVAKRV